MDEKKNSANASECTHDCSTCGAECSSKQKKESLIEAPNSNSRVKKIIGVVSGKGGVGKSLVTSMMSVITNRRGYKTAIMDADVTGPSIPKVFGVHDEVRGSEAGMIPPVSKNGIKVMSVNLLLEDETVPVVWRGPVIAGTVKQFWTDVCWEDVDYMYVDMPPGTGDVPLTVFQSLPLSGIIIVTTPQELVSMIVSKAVRMAQMMNIPVIGIVENMSYAVCPDCGKKIDIFGESHIDEIATAYALEVIGRIPIDSRVAALCDSGNIEDMENDYLGHAVDIVVAKTKGNI